MPNWSYNNLKISGSPEKMKEFYSIAIKPNINNEMSFRFPNIFPMPEKIKNTVSPSSSAKDVKWMNEDKVAAERESKISDVLGTEPSIFLIPCENNTTEKCKYLIKEYGADNWYDWNVSNYGTKWDVESLAHDIDMSDDEFITSFDTAWSPPSTFLGKLQDKFPELDIRCSYTLEGSDDCGLFETNRYEEDGKEIVSLELEEAESRIISDDGRAIYMSEDGDYKYCDDDEICEDWYAENPFD
jgi:hypothetical protein